jgi:hypothetical protein
MKRTRWTSPRTEIVHLLVDLFGDPPLLRMGHDLPNLCRCLSLAGCPPRVPNRFANRLRNRSSVASQLVERCPRLIVDPEIDLLSSGGPTLPLADRCSTSCRSGRAGGGRGIRNRFRMLSPRRADGRRDRPGGFGLGVRSTGGLGSNGLVRLGLWRLAGRSLGPSPGCCRRTRGRWFSGCRAVSPARATSCPGYGRPSHPLSIARRIATQPPARQRGAAVPAHGANPVQ